MAHMNGYALGDEFDRGGQARLYRGNTPDGTPCIFKEYDGAQHEFDMIKKVNPHGKSPHVIHAFDYLADNGSSFVVLEELWKTLYDLLSKTPLNPAGLAYIAIGTCKALKALCNGGVVHRDFQPANIFISRKQQRIVVGDFGLSTLIGETSKDYPERISAPEVEHGQSCETSDCYSWARSWELMITGMCDIGPQYRVTDIEGAKWASVAFAEILRQCTSDNPKDRIHPSELVKRVEKALMNTTLQDGKTQFADGIELYPYES